MWLMKARRVSLLVAGVVLAWAPADAGAAITITITQPGPGALAASSVAVTGSYTSDVAVANITATVGTTTVPLTFPATSFEGTFSGSVALTGLPHGTTTVTVTVTDVLNTAASESVDFMHDTPPTVEVTKPVGYTAATPNVLIQAQCVDDAPACTLQARIGSTVIATGTVSLDEEVSLAQWDGRFVSLVLTAIDSSGQTMSVSRGVDVTDAMVEVVKVPGPILAASANYVLFDEGTRIGLWDRSTGQSTIIKTGANATYVGIPDGCYITPTGAIFVDSPNYAEPTTYEYRNGTLIQHDGRGFPQVAGDGAMWRRDDGIYRYNIIEGIGAVVPVSSLIAALWGNGDIFFMADGQLKRYRDGTITILADQVRWAFPHHLEIDGTNVAWASSTGNGVDTGYRQINFYRGSGVVEEVAEFDLFALPEGTPRAFDHYGLRNGWLGFARVTGNVLQVYRRNSNGTEQRLTGWNDHSWFDAIGPNGDVMLFHGGRRYLATGDAMPELIGPGQGRAFYDDGRWFVIIDDTLYEINATGSPAVEEPDVGPFPIPSEDAPGCGCSGGQPAGPLALALVLLFALRRRRRTD